MSKLSFRARALDASKPMPIYYMDDVPEFQDFATINRAVPQMPTGMEKEEECEHHLQRAISAQQAYGHTGELVIPTPEVYNVPKHIKDELYPATYKSSRQLIHVQPFSMDQDIPDYDIDSEDEIWLSEQAGRLDIRPLQFEEMMDRLEKSSGQQVITLKEAKLLLRDDDDIIIAVYDYWLNKRLKTQHPLIPQVKTEKRDGSTNNNPYVAFRRRTEKMQTRKNRKNDEASYEKMLKLRRDLSRAVTLLEFVKRREKSKREHLHLTVEIVEKRYQAGDFSGQLLAEVSAIKHSRPNFIPVNSSQIVIKPDTRVTKTKPIN
ncbi:Enhancer of polycomb-like protein, partial [Stegodyphus mimosarum]